MPAEISVKLHPLTSSFAMSVVLETTLGALTLDLYSEARPKLCKNFLKLCKVKAYNFCLFHNVQPGFLAQTGDPTGTGRGGESVYGRIFGDQAAYFEGDPTEPKIKHSKRGALSMVAAGAAAGDNMFGSQFFITLEEELDYLDGRHAVFGEVAEGFEVIDKFNKVISDDEHRPYQDIRITHTVVLDDPFEDPARLDVPPASPEPDPEMLRTDRLGAEEAVEDDSDDDPEELAERAAEKEARARATILEMVGDLPDADCAPPENVLFVCKLNPVTSDDDLEIIFSRFGKVVSCEVIRDRKSGDSLQYAFVEFDNPKSCETAYFKMDNVLIDDRRIHVDFSQSVSKFRWKGKGRLEVVGEEDSKDSRRPPPQGKRREKRQQRSPPRREKQQQRRRSRSRSPDRSNRQRRQRSRSRSPRDRKRGGGGDDKKRSRDSRSRSRSPQKSNSRRRQRSRSRSRDKDRKYSSSSSSAARPRSRSRDRKRKRRSRSREDRGRDSREDRDRRGRRGRSPR